MRTMQWIVVGALLLGGCIPNETGHLETTVTGQLLDPPAPRQDATLELRAVCGEPAPSTSAMVRLPYLQSVSSDRASLLWTTSGGASTVALWSPSLERTEVRSEVMPTEFLAGAQQRVAHLTDLSADTIYCYEVLDDAGERAYGPYGFRTAPEADTSERIDFVVFGDSGGGGPDQAAVAEQITSVPIDFLLHTGDVAYTSGTLDQFETNYFQMYESWLGELPVFPASGNHDYVTADLGPFREVFELPENGGQSGRERWYSFDWGPVHVTVLDTENGSDAQTRFLEQDLASTDRPWRVVIAHKGPYSSGSHGSNGTFRQLYEPILQRHGVQVVFTGHDHHYERTHPIGGVTYILTGGGGMSTRPVSPHEWTDFATDVLHFVYVSIEGDTMRVHAIDATGQEFDGVEIPRQ